MIWRRDRGGEEPRAPESLEQPFARPSMVFQAAPPTVLTDKELEHLRELAVAGELVTAPNGSVPADERLRSQVAVFRNGTVLIVKGARASAEVANLLALARRIGIEITREYECSLQQLQLLYQVGSRRVDPAARSSDRQIHLSNIIAEAVRARATDIHLHVRKDVARIRIRVNGAMRTMAELGASEAKALIRASFSSAEDAGKNASLAHERGARITDRKLVPEGVELVRVYYQPAKDDGGYCAFRILPVGQASDSADIDHLGYNERQLEQIKRLRRRSGGVVFIGGPPGSGKSTTLKNNIQAMHRERRGEEVTITIEDPPEYDIPEAAQIVVPGEGESEDRSTQIAKSFMGILRQNADVIMVGEVRDATIAKLVFEAAVGGHRVWASIHCDTAFGTIDRLRGWGVEPYLLTNPRILRGLINQRLLRELCTHCRVDLHTAVERGLIDPEVAERARHAARGKGARIYCRDPKGCSHCDRGYTGRTVVAEVIETDAKVLKTYWDGEHEEAERYWREQLGGSSMFDHAVEKMAEGRIDPDEVEQKTDFFPPVALDTGGNITPLGTRTSTR